MVQYCGEGGRVPGVSLRSEDVNVKRALVLPFWSKEKKKEGACVRTGRSEYGDGGQY